MRQLLLWCCEHHGLSSSSKICVQIDLVFAWAQIQNWKCESSLVQKQNPSLWSNRSNPSMQINKTIALDLSNPMTSTTQAWYIYPSYSVSTTTQAWWMDSRPRHHIMKTPPKTPYPCIIPESWFHTKDTILYHVWCTYSQAYIIQLSAHVYLVAINSNFVFDDWLFCYITIKPSTWAQ